MPLPDVHMSIVDADDWTRELPHRRDGRDRHPRAQLMRRYWNNPEETANVLRRDVDGTLVLLTGDLGYFDEDGYLFIVDRKKDLIKTSGCQVWPREIEEVIATHPRSRGKSGVGRACPDARRKGKCDGRGSFCAERPRSPKRTCAPSALTSSRRTRSRPASRSAKSSRRLWSEKVLRRALVAEVKRGARRKTHVAGQGRNTDQSKDARKPSSGGCTVLNVNANCDGPCSSRCASRFFASSTPGMWPLGTHHRAAYAPPKFSNHARRPRRSSACAVP